MMKTSRSAARRIGTVDEDISTTRPIVIRRVRAARCNHHHHWHYNHHSQHWPQWGLLIVIVIVIKNSKDISTMQIIIIITIIKVKPSSSLILPILSLFCCFHLLLICFAFSSYTFMSPSAFLSMFCQVWSILSLPFSPHILHFQPGHMFMSPSATFCNLLSSLVNIVIVICFQVLLFEPSGHTWSKSCRSAVGRSPTWDVTSMSLCHQYLSNLHYNWITHSVWLLSWAQGAPE